VIDQPFTPPLRSSVPAHRDNAKEPSGNFSDGYISFLSDATRPRVADRAVASRVRKRRTGKAPG
jgi:hypothetical protein